MSELLNKLNNAMIVRGFSESSRRLYTRAVRRREAAHFKTSFRVMLRTIRKEAYILLMVRIFMHKFWYPIC